MVFPDALGHPAPLGQCVSEGRVPIAPRNKAGRGFGPPRGQRWIESVPARRSVSPVLGSCSRRTDHFTLCVGEM